VGFFSPNDITVSSADCLYPHIDISALWDTEYPMITVARILYGERTSEENRIYIRKANGYGGWFENSVLLNTVDDVNVAAEWFAGGREVPAAAALRKFNVEARAFINEELRAGVINIKRGRNTEPVVYMLFPQVTQWMFKDKPITDWEKKFLLSLSGSGNEYTNMVQEHIAERNISMMIKKRQFDNFVGKLLDIKLETQTRMEKETLVQIKNHESAIRDLLAKYTDICNQIAGIKAGHADDSISDFKTMFLNNPNCFLKQITGSTVVFYLNGFVTNFDEEAYEAVSRETDSSLYSNSGRCPATRRQLKTMFDELFLGNRYRLNLFGGFTLDFARNTIRLIDGCNCDEAMRNAMPNPHIVYYQCGGGFTSLHNVALMRGDYAEVLDIAFSQVQNINWSDYSPVSRFAEGFYTTYWNKPCIWDKRQSQFIAPEDLYQRIKEAEADEN